MEARQKRVFRTEIILACQPAFQSIAIMRFGVALGRPVDASGKKDCRVPFWFFPDDLYS